MLHVRIHLLLVLGLAVCLSWMSLPVLGVLAGMMALWHVALGWPAVGSLLRGVWRLKWLILAISLVYVWLPGPAGDEPLWWEAVQRSLVLLALLAAVHTLLFEHPALSVGAALAEGLRPLDRVGIPGTTFARRLAMLMEVAMGERERLAKSQQARGASWFRELPRRLAEQVQHVEEQARWDASVPANEFPALGPSPFWQWILLGSVWFLLAVVLIHFS